MAALTEHASVLLAWHDGRPVKLAENTSEARTSQHSRVTKRLVGPGNTLQLTFSSWRERGTSVCDVWLLQWPFLTLTTSEAQHRWRSRNHEAENAFCKTRHTGAASYRQQTTVFFARFHEILKSMGLWSPHQKLSPRHSQSNGKAERAVKEAEKILLKCKKAGSDAFLALLDRRNTPPSGIQIK